MTNKPIIEIKNVSKTFRIPHEKEDSLRGTIFRFWKPKKFSEFKALQNISFSINSGEFVGIIGRNGSGKSTILKILAGVYTPDDGNVEINGSISPFLELGVGFNGELTAKENVFLNSALLGLSEEETRTKFEGIIAFAELEDFVDTKVKNFSSGMYARLAFSIAIQSDASIFIMDEVLAVGDVNFQKKCFEIFEEYKKQGKTIILVSHSMDQILKMSDRVLFFDSGNLVKEGSAEKIVSFYLNYHNQKADDI